MQEQKFNVWPRSGCSDGLAEDEMKRPEMLNQLHSHTAEWDIIIVGGGATGVGVAIDAASRGYDTLLLEGSDFGKGTSSRSTKLVHGGVRYLEQGNVEDVLCRRTRSLFLNAKAAMEAALKVASLMAHELEYDSNWESTQLVAFQRVAMHFSLEKEPAGSG